MARRRAELEVRIETPHGAPVQCASVRIYGPSGSMLGKPIGPGRALLSLQQCADYELVVVPPDTTGIALRPLRTVLFFSKNGKEYTVSALSAPEGARSRIAEVFREGSRHVARVILDYVWFSHEGFAPTVGNRVEILIDGENGWGAVAQELQKAEQSIRITTWNYEPSMELVRDDPLTEPSARERNTIQRMLESRAKAGVLVQLLLWDPPLLPLPEDALRAALTDGDNFEVLAEKNPTGKTIFGGRHSLCNMLVGDLQIGSFHQKTIVVDGRVGFCGGMNMRENDWDSRLHKLFDARRCRFSRPKDFRARVKDGLASADHPPRHDFMARLEGPALAHLEENFKQRWNRLIESKAEHAERSSLIPEIESSTESVGPTAVQVVRTMPAPLHERGILDVYLRAISNAKRLVYIEDQYFRSTHLSEALAEAARKNDRLSILVVSSEAQANHPLVGTWTHACFERIAEARPDFSLYSLRVACRDGRGKRRVVEVDNHGKLLIVDDVFLSVGSCNANDRGFEYEGECNLAVHDPALVSALRQDLFCDYLEQDEGLGQSIERDVEIFRERAERNAVRPPDVCSHPFVVPFTPKPRRSPPIFDRAVF